MILQHNPTVVFPFDFIQKSISVSDDENGPRRELHKDAVFISMHKFLGGPGETKFWILQKLLKLALLFVRSESVHI